MAEDPPGPDLAREALHRARAAARERAKAAGAPVRRRAGTVRPLRPDPGGDPVGFGEAIRSLLEERGWGQQAASSAVLARWEQMVGPELAAHSAPVSLRAGVLTVEAESTSWATQIRLMAASVLARLEAEAGAGVVTGLVVRGPTGGPRRPGPLRVPGGRGPRDTYG